jgi:hypothetical protein
VLARRLYSMYLVGYRARTVCLTIVEYVFEDVYAVGRVQGLLVHGSCYLRGFLGFSFKGFSMQSGEALLVF